MNSIRENSRPFAPIRAHSRLKKQAELKPRKFPNSLFIHLVSCATGFELQRE